MSLQFLEDVYMYHIYRYILQCGVHIYYIQSVTIRSKCQFLCERNIFVQNDFFSHITLPQCIIFCIYFNHKHATIFNDNLLQVIFNFPSFNEFYDRLAISFQDDSLLSYICSWPISASLYSPQVRFQERSVPNSSADSFKPSSLMVAR